MRRGAALLLVINLLLALWFLLRPSTPGDDVSDENRLHMVSEVSGLQIRPDANCLFVGPVREGRVVRDIRNLHSGWQEINRLVPGAVRYRVFISENAMPAELPGDAGESDLLSAVRLALEEASLGDVESYLMTEGEFAGSVSLGLFAELNNAERLLGRLQEGDIEAEMGRDPLLEEQPWLAELASNVPPRALSAMENLLLTRPEMRIEENLCEMFALRE